MRTINFEYYKTDDGYVAICIPIDKTFTIDIYSEESLAQQCENFIINFAEDQLVNSAFTDTPDTILDDICSDVLQGEFRIFMRLKQPSDE